MSPSARGGFAPLLAPDLRRVYLETGKERPLEYPLLFNIDSMEWNPVKDQQIAGLGTMPAKPEGVQFSLDEPVVGSSIEYTAAPFGLAFEVTWEMWRDDLYAVMREMAAELARSARNRQEVEAWSIINNGFDNAFPGFDALSLFHIAHTGIREGNQANRPTPDIQLSITGIQNMVTRFENMVDGRGLPRLMAPVLIGISPNNKFVAREILGSSGKPYTADNEINALIEEDLSWMVIHYLTTTTTWFGAAAKGIHDLNFLWRDRPLFDAFDDPWTKNAVFTSYQRFAKGFGSYRGLDGSTG